MLQGEETVAEVGEICQFLSTLLILYGTDIDPEVRRGLIAKLRQWKTQYRGEFAAETAERCLSVFNPSGKMAVMIPMMRKELERGVSTCRIGSCHNTPSGGNSELMQCGK